MERVEIVSGKRHTAHGLNFYLSYFDDVAKVLNREDLCFIVGGWVRDRLLGEPVGYNIDVDFLVTCDPLEVAKRLAERIGGRFFIFEKKGLLIKRPVIASVVLNLPPYRYRFDFSQIKGGDIEKALEEDLRDRDFTANAMAVSLDDVLSIGAKQTIIYDPTGGVRDLEEGVLRPVSLENLKKDPIRILRGFRIAVEKDLRLTEDFLEFAEENKDLVLRSSPERITYELFRIMKHPRSSKTIKRLYEAGLLEVLIPEIADLKKIRDQGEHHLYPLDLHTFKTLEELERVLEEREKHLSPDLLEGFGSLEVMGEFSDVELLKWASLLHDIGKPRTFEIREGKVTFLGHDKVGEEMVREIGKRLRWGSKATDFVARLVRHHLRPFYLRESLRKGDLKRKGKAKFWRECGDIAPHLFLLAVADARASGDSPEDMEDLLETFRVLEAFRKEEMRETDIKPLLNGREIMEILGIPEGRTVGEIKKRLEDAQMEGRVKTKEEAREFVKEVYREILSGGGADGTRTSGGSPEGSP
jgi:poly(A) polymerase